MEHLVSPKLTLGVHCLILRHKGMYVMAAPDPDESNFYDTSFESTAYWCAETQTGIGPDGAAGQPPTLSGEPRPAAGTELY